MSKNWLDSIELDKMSDGALPIDRLLDDCLFYPAAGSDITPLTIETGIHSFVYGDWDHAVWSDNLSNLVSALNDRGYSLQFQRFFSSGEVGLTRDHIHLPNGFDSWRYMQNTLSEVADARISAYASWMVFSGPAVGADAASRSRYSVLYFHEEAMVLYDLLFNRRGQRPRVGCLIRPGNLYVTGWTDFDGTYVECMRRNTVGMPPQMCIWHRQGNPDDMAEIWHDICRTPPVSTVPKVGEEELYEVSLFDVR